MSLRRAAVFALLAALVAPPALAQDDDLLVPIEATPKESKPKPKPAKRRPAKKPAKKPATAQKPPPAPAPEDDLLVPIAAGKTELLVRLGGGVKGARLLVDNKEVGALPQGAFTVEPGEHLVVVRRPGFAEFSRRINVEKGKTAELSVALDAVAGVVSVNADVPGAKVSIDGQPRGQVPLANVELKPGSHEIVVSREGFESDVSRIAVRAGRDYTVSAHLKPVEGSKPPVVASADRPQQPVLTPTTPTVDPLTPVAPPEEPSVSEDRPWFKRWYVWAGVGAVVAAAAAGTVVATQGGSARPLSPEEVCGGTCDGTLNGVVRFR
ncbi:PEGA domain-containing protein [Hyalangium rubrum]|uniref:PEGA domain-containing protein n=1 Tax=Hyalangium rubrum TaxID=3103134 RepID=A0ABU5H5A2_9BACT|nr:PEGA domain-containing protein [Hyalangium sp. s54d21]MDY7228510.1 PEGA domain-containing protein [Hyalangium sp. s54d21]